MAVLNHCRPLNRGEYLRRALALLLPWVPWSCQSPPPKWPPPHVGQETAFSISLNPRTEFDILFLVDNSPTMATKQTALASDFPRMIQMLQQIPDPSGGVSLPDVHIGVVSSDLGAGTQAASSNGRILGDRGLLWGNDPSPGAIATVAGGTSNGCGLNLGARWIEDSESPDGSGRTTNYTGKLADVFSCLATAVGVGGSFYPQPLQALRMALNPSSGINEANRGFLREGAYLAIIIISDQDDCSADPNITVNDGIFLQNNPGDTVRLRCAARGHICNGQSIPDYDPAIGYTGQGFTASFADCAPKDQSSPPDPSYLPLIGVQDIVDSVNAIKARPQERILVSGVIGWPPDSPLADVYTSNQYQIGKDSTAPSPQDTLWNYMPICEIPSITSADGNIYKAYGGLRLKRFLDAFQKTDFSVSVRNTFSICNADFLPVMAMFDYEGGPAIKPLCIGDPLIDTDPSTPEIEPDCQAVERRPCETPGQGGCLPSGYQEKSFPECRDGQGNLIDPENATTGSVPDDNRPCWYLYYDTSAAGCPDSFKGQRITVLRQTGYDAPPNSILTITCLTCPKEDQPCPASDQ